MSRPEENAEERSILQPQTCEDLERGDEIPVLSCENGTWTGGQEVKPKRNQYAVRPRLPGRQLPPKCREASILATGILLTCVALGLIVAGASRLQECQKVTLLKINHPLRINEVEELGDEMFTIAQLTVLTNYAYQRPALQSSTVPSTQFSPEVDGDASLAVDGSTDTCSRTDEQRMARWQVDLGRMEPIRSIRILSSNTSRLTDFEVYIGPNPDIQTNRLCYRHHGRSNSTDIRVTCRDQLSGSHVGIVQHAAGNDLKSLVLCEVLIFGQ